MDEECSYCGVTVRLRPGRDKGRQSDVADDKSPTPLAVVPRDSLEELPQFSDLMVPLREIAWRGLVGTGSRRVSSAAIGQALEGPTCLLVAAGTAVTLDP
jgi:hypothetical protein